MGRRENRTPRRSLSMPNLKACEENDAGNHANIRVVVRVRPENTQERNGASQVVVRTLGENMLVFDPKDEGSPGFYQGRRRQGRDMTRRKNRDIRFAFDHVFDEDATNEEVFEGTTKDILDGLLNGYNCSVFAYGATGAGKTFTMLGSPNKPGVMFLTMVALYEHINSMKDEKTCEVAVSYLEVYNEQIRDLLLNSGTLPVREDANSGVIVTGLSLHKLNSAEELFHLLQLGNQNRTQHPTDANAESSRSHAVFQIFVRQKDRTASLSTEVRVGKMSLIDLAGSERATVTTNRGDRFREGANINKSLLALGNCINALAEGKEAGYVPYRNSKLTRLLKDSLGGNCRTVMIAAISPSSLSYEDTYNTLKYADRAKHIKATLKRNVVSVDHHITKYAKIVDELKIEVIELKDRLRQYEDGSALESDHMLPGFNVLRFQNAMNRIFKDRVNVRKELLELEACERDVAFNVHFKEIHLNRIQLINPGLDMEEKSDAVSSRLKSLKARQPIIQERKDGVSERMTANEECLKQLESDMRHVRPDGKLPQILEENLQKHHLEIEVRDLRRCNKFLRKFCRLQRREAQATERLVCDLLRIVRQQYFILKGHGLTTSDVTADFEGLSQAVVGEREVAWADQSTTGDVSVLELHSQVKSGSTYSQAQCTSSLDINQLVTFPTITCSMTTPIAKTPHAKSRIYKTPKRTPKTPRHQTPRHDVDRWTPKKGSNIPTPCHESTVHTPHRDWAPPTPTSGDSLRLRLTDTLQLKQDHVLSEAISSAVQDRLDISSASAQSVGPEHRRNFSDSAADGENDQDRTFVVNAGQTPYAKSDQHCLPSAKLTNSKTDSRACHLDCHASDKNSSACSQLKLVTPHLVPPHMIDQTFTIDGVFPLQPSPTDGANKTKSCVQQELASTQPTECLQSKQQHQQDAKMRKLDDKHISEIMSAPQQAQLPKVCGKLPKVCGKLDHSVEQPVPVIATSNEEKPEVSAPPKINSATVTKLHPQQSSESSRSSTVTKSRPTVQISCDKENMDGPLQDRRLQVIRSMDFSAPSCPSPGTKMMTFADVVKSPIRNGQLSQTTRSPLSSRENLPQVPVNFSNSKPSVDGNQMTSAPQIKASRHGFSGIPRQKLFKSSSHVGLNMMAEDVISQTQKHGPLSHASAIVQRLGLPSVLEAVRGRFHSELGSGNKPTIAPGYMQMTKSSSRRVRHHRRSMSAEGGISTDGTEFGIPIKRLKIGGQTLKQPARVISRSNSTAHLIKKSTFF